jgi:hypothetical protein|nr:MAG TPA: hypothetical protein [Caudoviricetes sp.]
MIDDELRLIVTEFVAVILDDRHCESILLDVREDARVDSDLSVLYLDVIGKRYGCTLNIVGCEYSVSIRDRDTNETITTVKGRDGAWELRELLAEIKTKLWEDK